MITSFDTLLDPLRGHLERLCAPLRCSCVSFGLCWVSLNLFVGSSGGLGGSLGALGVVFKVFKTSCGVLGTFLELSWSLFVSSWSLFGASLRALGASLRALGDVLGLGEPLFSKTSVSPRRVHDFGNLYEQQREASY